MYHLPASLKITSDFIEDTSVVVVFAYLLARGGILPTLFREHATRAGRLRAGLVLGAIALTEVLFPNERYPYIIDTLATTFAMFTAGPLAALTCAAVASIGEFAYVMLHIIDHHEWLLRTADVFAAMVVAGLIRPGGAAPYNRAIALAVGALAELAAVGQRHLFAHPSMGDLSWTEVGAIVGNGLGMLLMTTVVNEAWMRLCSERNRVAADQASLKAERALTLAAKAELTALRARIRPHFLYNALGAIAGLCAVDPEEAVEATEQLGSLIRQTFESSDRPSISVALEVERVKTYIGIQQKRYGKRLSVAWRVDDDCAAAHVPPLSLQTLVENAVIHGVGKVTRPVSVTIAVRRVVRGRVCVAVRDDGPGITSEARASIQSPAKEAAHGLQILSQQLILQHGARSRLRHWRASPTGTLAFFSIPHTSPQLSPWKGEGAVGISPQLSPCKGEREEDDQ